MRNGTKSLRRSLIGAAASLAAIAGALGAGTGTAHALISDDAADRIAGNCEQMGGKPELIFDEFGELAGVRCVLPDGRSIVCIDDYAAACYWESVLPVPDNRGPRYAGDYAGDRVVAEGVGTSPSPPTRTPTVAAKGAMHYAR